ncbi:MAG: ATP-binding cassette domain-containing protein, partial [Lysobacterales bacterium]
MSAATPVISVRGVVNRFGSQVVHDGVDLDVYPGEVLGIVGGSGSGKSVLLRTMLGLHRPTAGEVRVEGRVVGQMSESEMLGVKRRYGVTFQHGALFSSLTVAE